MTPTTPTPTSENVIDIIVIGNDFRYKNSAFEPFPNMIDLENQANDSSDTSPNPTRHRQFPILNVRYAFSSQTAADFYAFGWIPHRSPPRIFIPISIAPSADRRFSERMIQPCRSVQLK